MAGKERKFDLSVCVHCVIKPGSESIRNNVFDIDCSNVRQTFTLILDEEEEHTHENKKVHNRTIFFSFEKCIQKPVS